MSLPSVAICQQSIILGGRLRVIIEIIKILNELGIVPDIITTRLSFKPEQISEKYGKQVRVNFRFIPRIPRLRQEYAIALFNASLRHYASDYDLLINTSNSLIFLPGNKSVLTYMFYPRKSRLMAEALSIHEPEKKISPWTRTALHRSLQRRMYRWSHPKPQHKIICMTKFTCSALAQVYELPETPPIIYPPVDIAVFQSPSVQRRRSVVTLGRFGPDKRQIEQIKLAQQLPDMPFHIIGFAHNSSYYQRCQQYVSEHAVKNVHLHPDAPFSEILKYLQGAKYFLHTLINEPFGITAVQAVAAGCLPIVHDSGGQRETIPDPRLRYQNLEQVPEILSRLEKLDSSSVSRLLHRLQDHITSHFDTRIFRTEMRKELLALLNM